MIHDSAALERKAARCEHRWQLVPARTARRRLHKATHLIALNISHHLEMIGVPLHKDGGRHRVNHQSANNGIGQEGWPALPVQTGLKPTVARFVGQIR
jgi:hypothetical protein